MLRSVLFAHSLILLYAPVLHAVKRLFISDVVHEDETHGTSVVGRRNRAVSLLACCVLIRAVRVN
jgi:hypothetical protein